MWVRNTDVGPKQKQEMLGTNSDSGSKQLGGERSK